MKTPDILMDMKAEDFETVNQFYAQEQTARELRSALYDTRKQYGGLSLEGIANVITDVFDVEETKALINELNKHEE